MKTTLLIFLLLFTSYLFRSQVMDLTWREQAYFENVQKLKMRDGDTDPTIEGSPYFIDDFNDGSLLHGSKDSIKVNIR